MYTVYVYVLDTLADWEIGHVTAELHSKRFFKKDAPQVAVKTVGISKEPVKTMGGLTVTPDCVLDDMEIAETSVLLLPGADTWNDPKHATVIEKAGALLSAGGTVCGICGASPNMPSCALPNTKDRRLGALKPMTSARKRNTPATRMWIPAAAG